MFHQDINDYMGGAGQRILIVQSTFLRILGLALIQWKLFAVSIQCQASAVLGDSRSWEPVFEAPGKLCSIDHELLTRHVDNSLPKCKDW